MDKAVRKNLIYFIYWSPENGMLEYNLNLIEKYLNLFDGKIIVMVSGIEGKQLPKRPILQNYISVKNDFLNGEKEYFKYGLGLLPKDDSITFYAHAKGVSREVNNALQWWVKLLYKGNLDMMPDLHNYLFSGCFGKLRTSSHQCPLAFHYSGSFFWFKTKEVLKRYEGKAIPDNINTRWFTENFPAFISKQKECEFRLWSGNERKMNFYSVNWWNKHPQIKKLAR
jgi:hypothetical protein